MLFAWLVLVVARAASSSEPVLSLRRTVVFLRIQKTGSKTLLSILEQCAFTACPKRGIGAVDSKACDTVERTNALRSSRSREEFACHISSHCGIQAFDSVFNESLLPKAPPQARARSSALNAKSLPPALLQPRMPFIVTVIRDATTRYLSEFRHVCQSGQGQWDYSTLQWRYQEAARLNFTIPPPKQPPTSKSMSEKSREASERRQKVRHATLTKQRLARGLPAPPPLNLTKRPALETHLSKEKKKEKPPPFSVDCASPEAVLTFLKHPDHMNGARNRQTRMLAGALMIGDHPDPRPEEELFALAMKNLDEKIDAAIVFEKFHLSLVVLAKKLDLPPPATFSILKERTEDKPKAKVNRTVLEAVAHYNRYDKLLHDECERRLDDDAKDIILLQKKQRRLTAETEVIYDCGVPDNKTALLHWSTMEKMLHYYEAQRCGLVDTLRNQEAENQRKQSATFSACVKRNADADKRESTRTRTSSTSRTTPDAERARRDAVRRASRPPPRVNRNTNSLLANKNKEYPILKGGATAAPPRTVTNDALQHRPTTLTTTTSPGRQQQQLREKTNEENYL